MEGRSDGRYGPVSALATPPVWLDIDSLVGPPTGAIPGTGITQR